MKLIQKYEDIANFSILIAGGHGVKWRIKTYMGQLTPVGPAAMLPRLEGKLLVF